MASHTSAGAIHDPGGISPSYLELSVRLLMSVCRKVLGLSFGLRLWRAVCFPHTVFEICHDSCLRAVVCFACEVALSF